PKPDYPATGDAASPKIAPDPAKVEQVKNKGAFGQRSNHDKLATDKVGEELEPDASIWRLYAEEAKEYDTEMAQERNKNLDTMLLFATLFSAIVTAFIIESTRLLEQDDSEVSTQFLLALVQSQQRIETGTPNITSPPVEMPEFSPSTAARVINVLWFASLMISLGAAVVAILAKEWLSAFTSYRTRHAYEYALQRQARLTSLNTWNMLPIIDMLPTLLNFALFIFSLGLIVRLWLLDFVVAGVITTISAIVGGFYFFFVIAGAMYQPESCPYQARICTYIRRVVPRGILQYLATSNSVVTDTQHTIKPEVIELLTWLLNYSSDPTLKSYITQALAGLKSLSLELSIFPNKKVEELHATYNQNNTVLAPLFDLGTQAIDQLRMAPTRGRTELASCGGSNAARIATAIGEIYPYALTWELCNSSVAQEHTPNGAAPDNISEQTKQTSTLIINLQSARQITENVFDALDLVWAETSPALTPSAYAYLATAELKMVRHALAFLSSGIESKASTSQGHSSIEMNAPPNIQARIPSLDQDSLHERYCRALSRTALVIKSSLDHLISKGSQQVQSAIVGLLSEATKLVEQEKPGSSSTLHRFGTDIYPQLLNEEISITISTGSNTMRRVTCQRQIRNFELMESLIELCEADASVDALRLESFRVAAFNLLVTFWPAYYQQRSIDELRESKIPTWAVQDWTTVPFQNIPYDSQTSAEVIIYRSIVLTYVSIALWAPTRSFVDRRAVNEHKALQLALKQLLSGSSALSQAVEKLKRNATWSRLPIFYQWLPTYKTLGPWIRLISDELCYGVSGDVATQNQPLNGLSWCVARLISTISTLGNRREEFYLFGELQSTDLDPQSSDVGPEYQSPRVDQVMTLISAASKATGRDVTAPVMGALFRQVTNYIITDSSDSNDYLHTFTKGHGLAILANQGSGLVESDHAAAAGVVCAVVTELQTAGLCVEGRVVPSLFEAMCLVCDSDDHQDDQDSFVHGALFQIQRLPGGIGRFVTLKTLSSIQKVLGKLKEWEEMWNGHETSNFIEIVSLQRQVQQSAAQLPGDSSADVALISQKHVALGPASPQPQTTATSSKSDNQANNPAQNSYKTFIHDASDQAPSIRSISDTAPVPDEPLKGTSTGINSASDEASGSGQTHLIPPHEDKTSLEPGDEKVIPMANQGDEEQSTNESDEN
ncbi:hypothetical protein FRC11_007334, partial [Ceratobasidium sp. 423]